MIVIYAIRTQQQKSKNLLHAIKSIVHKKLWQNMENLILLKMEFKIMCILELA